MAIIILLNEQGIGEKFDMTENNETKNRLRLRLHYLLAFILLLHCLFFMVYWIAVGSFRASVDQFIGDIVGLTVPYTTIVMVLTALVGTWSLVRLIRLRLAVKKGEWSSSLNNWIFFGVWLFFMAGIYAAFLVIFKQNSSQKGVLIHLLNLIRLVSDAVLFLIAAVWLRQLILYLRRGMLVAKRNRWLWMVGIVLVLISVVGLWLMPTLLPPNWAYQGDLPTKPALITHRGASMLAPENTLAAAELAEANQALGFETDIRISQDGVPFLMHDETLTRTTNVAEVFPDRVNDRASSFTLEELKQLNAGLWFIQKDPFGTIDDGLVSQAQLSINQGQRIPTLAEGLELVELNGMVILFDMRYPPEDHPYYDEFFDIVLTICRESGLNGDVWFLVDRQNVQTVLEEAPQMTRVVSVSSTDLPSPGTLLDLQYEIVNVDTGIRTREIRAYREQGLGVNVYTIDEPWLFSQFWLSGVTSVTTNNVHTFSQLNTPFLNLPYSRYLLFWGLYGIIVAIWLASSQPEPELEKPRQMETPDLMDFAADGDDTVDTTQPPLAQEPADGQDDAQNDDEEQAEEVGEEQAEEQAEEQGEEQAEDV